MNGKIERWTGLLGKQFWKALFNDTPKSLMMQIEIPVKKEERDESIILIRKFIEELYQILPEKNKTLIFGEY